MAIRGFEKKDPMAGLNQLMQLMNQMSQMQDRKKDNINSSLANILELSKYATNEDSLANIKNQLKSQQSNASQYEETNVYYDLIGNVLNDRGAQITQYSNVVDKASEIVNSANFLREKGDFEKLPEWVKSQKDDEGNQKYDSVMQWVADEYAQIESYSNTIESGSKLGFRRGKGIDDFNIQTQIGQYKNRLDTTLEALIGDETITPEEAQLIIAGDRNTFIKQRDTKIRNITQGIEQYDEIIYNFDNEAVLKGLLEDLNLDIDIGDTSSEREAVLNTFIKERDKGVDNYKRWMGSDYSAAYKTSSQLEEEEFNIQTSEEDLPTLLSPDYKEKVIDKDKDRIPDTIDIDAGTGTDKPVKGAVNIEGFSSGEKLFTSAMKGQISDKEFKNILRDSGADVSTGIIFSLENKDSLGENYFTKSNLRKRHGDEIKKLDEWLNIHKEKSGLALNNYLLGDISLLQAANKSHSKDIKGRKRYSLGKIKSRQINAFKSKFNKSGLSLEEFIKQNDKEYRNVARLLKYAYYFKTQI